jgi:hypothetical protein
MSFDPACSRVSFTFRTNPRISEPNVIVVPTALHYPSGYCARATGARITSLPEASHVDVSNEGKAADVAVTITPGSC